MNDFTSLVIPIILILIYVIMQRYFASGRVCAL
uniref:Uncharacterized protein n=1 Tax=Anguilla anguilla TaxID=7936 RepID=A0A0E9US63_ANGAN